jgi:ABC-type multidrug transport system fused ATPase/permease subunit
MEAVRETAMFQAATAPHVAALGLALAVVAAVVVEVLGWRWLLLGVGALGVAGAVASFGRAKLKPVQDEAWREYGELVLDVRVLVEASAELRAHGCEGPFASALLGRVGKVARAERVASTWGAVLSLVPAAIAVLALAAPARAGVAWVTSALVGSGMANAGVLGGSGLVLGIALLGQVQTIVRSAPLRASFHAFLAQARPRRGKREGAVRAADLRAATIAFEHVSYSYPSATRATPSDVSFEWQPHRGLALVGENGVGKSTLALLLLGLVEPDTGTLRIGGVDRARLDREELGLRVAFVPQNAFVATGASVAWHLRLFARRSISDAAIDRALDRVGLLSVLEARAHGAPARDVRAGELSGGERQRMNLARALVEDAELVVLDEPEAGLDARGRELLRALLDELQATRRVLVIAHDESVVPAGFDRLRCVHGAASTTVNAQPAERHEDAT